MSPHRFAAACLGLCLAACTTGPEATFRVAEFGAVGDGTTPATSAIQQAIDACAAAGGGRVVIPTGRYLSG
jgi:polygalacturonase